MVSYLDSHTLAEYSSQVLSASGNAELDQRLGLYRVFLKLYEHHRSLLDEILELENTDQQWRSRTAVRFIQGVVQEGQTYLVTNLLKDQTQRIQQAQAIWVIGRDRKAALPIPDRRLSRCHAAIQYVCNEGFYLVDLNSTNGSFVNGEPVRQAQYLKDGDQIRLSSLTFTFFLCQASRVVAEVPPELIEQVRIAREAAISTADQRSPEPSASAADPNWDLLAPDGLEETSMFLLTGASEQESLSHQLSDLSPSKQAEILDRFLKR